MTVIVFVVVVVVSGIGFRRLGHMAVFVVFVVIARHRLRHCMS
jgi:hypothetical protein